MITRKCAVSGQDFIIEDEDLDFYAKMGVITEEQKSALHSLQASKPESQEGLEAEKIPENLLIGLPTLCPEERQRRRLAWRNERKLYKRKCDATGKDIISIYHKDVSFPVYEQSYWWSEKWDGLEYGQAFDFSRPFFEQFNELREKVPQIPLEVLYTSLENSEYCNCAGYLKNCYLIFNSDSSEKCFYGEGINHSFECFDSFFINECNSCYEVLDSKKCFFSLFLKDCKSVFNSLFCFNCRNCEYCFGSHNLRNKKYYFFNKKLSPHIYKMKVQEFLQKNSWDFLKKLFYKKKSLWVKNLEQNYSENSQGDYLIYSKNSYHCFDSEYLEDSKYCYEVKKQKDINWNNIDCSYFLGINESYDSTIGINNNSIYFSAVLYNSRNIYYSNLLVNNCSDCFGCVGLKKQKYCILNKQYTKEEYEELVPKIIAHMKETGEWGQFFPISMSPFAYNETVAQEYFPLTKEEALKNGYKWKYEEPVDTKKSHESKRNSQEKNNRKNFLCPGLQSFVSDNDPGSHSSFLKSNIKGKSQEFFWDSIPDDIKDVSDDILNTVLYCERTQKPYKIQKAELAFYRKMNLPIPHLHPDERHKDRMKLRNPRKLWTRKCADCECEIQTTFAPERPEKVLCVECYLKVVQ